MQLAKDVDMYCDDSNRWWFIVRMSPGDGAQEIKKASAKAADKLKRPKSDALEATKEMEKDLARMKEEKPVEVVDSDN
jgi:hypothetical protein